MKKIVFLYASFLFGCDQSQCQVNIGKLKLSPNIENSFFKDTIFLTSPSKLEVFRNDSLESSYQYPNKDSQISNAYIVDQNKVGFGFDKCEATFKGDTLTINFINPLKESLFIKVFEKEFIFEYKNPKLGKESIWRVCSQDLTLTPNFKLEEEKVFGKLSANFSINEKCVASSSIVLDGVFYYKRK